MTPEQVQAIAEAAKAGDESQLQTLLSAMEKAAGDQAAGVSDITAGLKAKNDELLGKLAAEKEKAAKASKDLEDLRLKTEQDKAARQAQDLGVDNDAVEKLAEERADRKFEAKVKEWEERTALLEERAKAGDSDREFLVGKLKAARIDHELFKVAGEDVDPTMWEFFRPKAEKHFQPRQNGEGDWWREDEIEFDLIDPASKTRLMNDKAQPMSPAELVDSRKSNEWQVFFPPKGKGGGARSQIDTPGGRTLGADASAEDYLGAAGIG